MKYILTNNKETDRALVKEFPTHHVPVLGLYFTCGDTIPDEYIRRIIDTTLTDEQVRYIIHPNDSFLKYSKKEDGMGWSKLLSDSDFNFQLAHNR